MKNRLGKQLGIFAGIQVRDGGGFDQGGGSRGMSNAPILDVEPESRTSEVSSRTKQVSDMGSEIKELWMTPKFLEDETATN